MDIERDIDKSNKIIDKAISIGDYSLKQSGILYKQSINKTIDESDKTPFLAYSLISLFINQKQSKLTNSINKKYDGFINEITNSLDDVYNIALSKADFNIIKQHTKID